MDTIDTQRATIDQLTAERDALAAGLHSISNYAVSEKFWRDPYIHNADITTRVNEVLSEWADINTSPYGAACLLKYESEVRARGYINMVHQGDGRWGEYPRNTHPETFITR